MQIDRNGSVRRATEKFVSYFESRGATRIETDILQPAETLLDVYGEDIRARAYVTNRAGDNELFLRPDFTVPVLKQHLSRESKFAKYTYSGKVFRKQYRDSRRPSEYYQVGIEYFGGENELAVDAVVFSTIAEALYPLRVRAGIGDLGILLSAIDGLSTTLERKTALRRHIWRPQKFRQLVSRFMRPPNTSKVSDYFSREISREQFEERILENGPIVGCRGVDEVISRLTSKSRDNMAAPLVEREVNVINKLLAIEGPISQALDDLERVRSSLPGMDHAVQRVHDRLGALEANGVDVSQLSYEPGFRQTTLEYYGGFVFRFVSPDYPQLPPVAQGGRYDGLIRMLGGEAGSSAVGGVIRPEIAIELADTSLC